MATISGKYLLKRKIFLLTDAQNVNFTSNNVSYTRIYTYNGMLTALNYYNSVSEVNSSVYTWYNEVTGEGVWNNTEYQVLDFGSAAQTVSSDFNFWLTNNAYPIASVDYTLRVNDTPSTEYQGQTVRFIINNGTAYHIRNGTSGGYTVTLDGELGYNERVYVQINDDPTWYYADLVNDTGFEVEATNIPDIYIAETTSETRGSAIAFDNVTTIRLGKDYPQNTYPRLHSSDSTGDFATTITFTATGDISPEYATSVITLTQDSMAFFEGGF